MLSITGTRIEGVEVELCSAMACASRGVEDVVSRVSGKYLGYGMKRAGVVRVDKAAGWGYRMS